MARRLLSISLSLALVSALLSFERTLGPNYAQAVPAAVPSAVTTMTVTTVISVYVPEPTGVHLRVPSSASGRTSPPMAGSPADVQDPSLVELLRGEGFPSSPSDIYAGPSMDFPSIQQLQQQQRQPPSQQPSTPSLQQKQQQPVQQVQFPPQQVQIPIILQIPSPQSPPNQQVPQPNQQQDQGQENINYVPPWIVTMTNQGPISAVTTTLDGQWISPRPVPSAAASKPTATPKTVAVPAPAPKAPQLVEPKPSAAPMSSPPRLAPMNAVSHASSLPSSSPNSDLAPAISSQATPAPAQALDQQQQVSPPSTPVTENRTSIVCYVDPSSSDTLYCTDGRVYKTSSVPTPSGQGQSGVFGSVPVAASSSPKKKKRSAVPSYSGVSSPDGMTEPWAPSAVSFVSGSGPQTRARDSSSPINTNNGDNSNCVPPLSYQQGQQYEQHVQQKRAMDPSSTSDSFSTESWPSYGMGPMSTSSYPEPEISWNDGGSTSDVGGGNKCSGGSSYGSGYGSESSNWRSGSGSAFGSNYGSGSYGGGYSSAGNYAGHKKRSMDSTLSPKPTSSQPTSSQQPDSWSSYGLGPMMSLEDTSTSDPDSEILSNEGGSTASGGNKYSDGSSYGANYGSGSGSSDWKSGYGSENGGYGGGYGNGGSYGGKHGSGHKKRQLVNPGGPIVGGVNPGGPINGAGSPGAGNVIAIPIDIGLLWDGTNVVPVPEGGSSSGGPIPASTVGGGPDGPDQVIPVPINIDTLVYPDGQIVVVPPNGSDD